MTPPTDPSISVKFENGAAFQRGPFPREEFDRFGLVTAKAAPKATLNAPDSEEDVWLWERKADSGLVEFYKAPAGRGYTGGIDGVSPTVTIAASTDGYDVTEYYYSAAGLLETILYADGTSEGWVYGDDGFVEQYLDPLNRETIYTPDNDGSGHVHTVSAPLDRGAEYTYMPVTASIDALPQGLIETVTKAGVTTKYVYYESKATDGAKFGLVKEIIHDEGGDDEASEYFDYDAFRHLVTYTNIYGAITSYVYDKLGRKLKEIHQIQEPNGSGGTTPRDLVIKSNYDTAGNLRSVVEPGAQGPGTTRTTNYLYDSRNQVVAVYAPPVTTATGAERPVTRYQYTATGQVSLDQSANGQIVANKYDERGELILSIQSPETQGGVVQNIVDGNAAPVFAAMNAPVTTKYVYDKAGNLAQTISSSGSYSLTTYDKLGRVQEQNSWASGASRSTATYEYFDDGQVEFVHATSPTGTGMETTEYAYDGAGRLQRIDRPLDQFTEYAYYADDSTESVATAAGETEYEYDNLGRTTKVTDALNHFTSTAYAIVDGIRTVTYTDARGKQTKYKYDTLGRVFETDYADPNGAGELAAQIVRQSYFDDGSLKSSTQSYVGADPADERVSSYTYDGAGLMLTSTSRGQTTSYLHDVSGNATRTDYADGTYSLNGYNDHGWLISTAQYASDNTLITQSTNAYNAQGQANRTINDGRAQTSMYDLLGRRISSTDALGNKTLYTYTAAGNLASQTDPLENTTSFEYDELGRRTAVIDALNGETTFTYDTAGNMLSLTDPVGNLTSWTYNAVGQKLTETIVVGSEDLTRHFVYDENGNLVDTIDRNDREIVYAYDALNRRSSETWLDDEEAPVHVFVYTYNAFGELTYAADGTPLAEGIGVDEINSAYAYGYNNKSQLTSVSNSGTNNLPLVTMTFGYDPAGRRTSVTDNFGGGVSYGYDSASRISSIAMVSSTGSAPRASFTYKPTGQIETVIRNVGVSGPTITTVNGYDQAGRLTSIVHTSSVTGQLSAFNYGYDSASRLTSYTGPEGTVNYAYDDTNQLTGASGAQSASYEYDANGNRIMNGYVVGDDNQILSDGIWDYEYDAEGNRVGQANIATGETRTYSWDYRNRLTGVVIRNSSNTITTQENFQYDVHDRLIGRSLDATGSGTFLDLYTVYDTARLPTIGRMADNVHADFNGAGSLATRYLFGSALDQIMARLGGSGDAAFYLADSVGSVRQIAEVDGDVLSDRVFSAFGQLESDSNPSASDRFGWQGREHDFALDLIQLRARWLAAGFNQFLSKDPIGLDAGDYNDRRLVGNHPTNAVDPTGLQQELTKADQARWEEVAKKDLQSRLANKEIKRHDMELRLSIVRRALRSKWTLDVNEGMRDENYWERESPNDEYHVANGTLPHIAIRQPYLDSTRRFTYGTGCKKAAETTLLAGMSDLCQGRDGNTDIDEHGCGLNLRVFNKIIGTKEPPTTPAIFNQFARIDERDPEKHERHFDVDELIPGDMVWVRNADLNDKTKAGDEGTNAIYIGDESFVMYMGLTVCKLKGLQQWVRGDASANKLSDYQIFKVARPTVPYWFK